MGLRVPVIQARSHLLVIVTNRHGLHVGDRPVCAANAKSAVVDTAPSANFIAGEWSALILIVDIHVHNLPAQMHTHTQRPAQLLALLPDTPEHPDYGCRVVGEHIPTVEGCVASCPSLHPHPERVLVPISPTGYPVIHLPSSHALS